MQVKVGDEEDMEDSDVDGWETASDEDAPDVVSPSRLAFAAV